MIEERKSGSVWNVALVAVALFLAAVVLAGAVTPAEITIAAAG